MGNKRNGIKRVWRELIDLSRFGSFVLFTDLDLFLNDGRRNEIEYE